MLCVVSLVSSFLTGNKMVGFEINVTPAIVNKRAIICGMPSFSFKNNLDKIAVIIMLQCAIAEQSDGGINNKPK